MEDMENEPNNTHIPYERSLTLNKTLNMVNSILHYDVVA